MLHQKQFQNIPQTPGVYMFKKNRVVLYIGKAANLKVRLRSYARPRDLDYTKRAMVAEATSISWEEMTNDIEALLKEATFIKRYRPKYNVLLRDDKNYFFVGFTKEKFPKIFITHQLRCKVGAPTASVGAVHIGPFTDGAAIKNTLRMLRRIFPYCVCKLPHTRLCQYAQIGLCFGFCCQYHETPCKEKNKAPRSAIAKVDILSYKKSMATIRAILSGRRVDIARKLKKEMRVLSAAKCFEEAAKVRDQFQALERIFAHRPFLQNDQAAEHEKGLRLLQIVAKLPSFPRRIEAYDISHHHGKESVGSMIVFEEGSPAKSQYRRFKIHHVTGINDPAMIQEVLIRRMRHPEWPLPDFILIDGGKPQLNAALQAIKTSLRGGVADEAIPLCSTGLLPPHCGVAMTKKIGAIAKRNEELYLSNKKPLALKTMPPPLLHLLQRLRNEAHRFAISFSSHRFRKQQIV